MKKALSLILALVMCLSLCACGSNGDEQQNKQPDPLVGKWEIDNKRIKGFLEFREEDDNLIGTCDLLNLSSASKECYEFTVKEKSDYSITFLYENGAEEKFSYVIWGNLMFLDGEYYFNPEKNSPTAEECQGYLMKDGMPYDIYQGIFLGMTVDAMKALGHKVTNLQTGSGSSYSSYSSCDYYAEQDIYNDRIQYDSFYYGFDMNLRLVYFRKNIYLDGDQYLSRHLSELKAAFGEYSYKKIVDTESDNVSYEEWYSWEYGDFIIRVRLDVFKSISSLYIEYYYVP